MLSYENIKFDNEPLYKKVNEIYFNFDNCNMTKEHVLKQSLIDLIKILNLLITRMMFINNALEENEKVFEKILSLLEENNVEEVKRVLIGRFRR